MPVPVIRKAALLAAALLAALLLAASAQAQAPKAGGPPASFTVISPVFSQLVSFSMPSNFVAGYEKTSGPNYTREAIPKGETVAAWTQMITITGAKGNTSSPEGFASGIAGGFKRACPDTFAAKPLGATKINGYDAFVAVLGCGRVGDGGSLRSETALLVAVKGSADLYTLQWAERGLPLAKVDVENAKWVERLKELAPIRLCAIVAGEKAPYPCCLGKP